MVPAVLARLHMYAIDSVMLREHSARTQVDMVRTHGFDVQMLPIFRHLEKCVLSDQPPPSCSGAQGAIADETFHYHVGLPDGSALQLPLRPEDNWLIHVQMMVKKHSLSAGEGCAEAACVVDKIYRDIVARTCGSEAACRERRARDEVGEPSPAVDVRVVSPMGDI